MARRTWATDDVRLEDVPVVPSAEMLDGLPVEESRQRFRSLLEVMTLKSPVLTLNVQEPLPDDGGWLWE